MKHDREYSTQECLCFDGIEQLQDCAQLCAVYAKELKTFSKVLLQNMYYGMQQIRASHRVEENRVNLKYSAYIHKHPRTQEYHTIWVPVNSMIAVTAHHGTLLIKLQSAVMKMPDIRCLIYRIHQPYYQTKVSDSMILDTNLMAYYWF